ncbi:TIGR03087 family PEP-CTERM/XrtA system glycosyltransferase [Massilia sp. CF038]|uniref:TIGR03087 family PEP-CTERM/XrtA system glycosyltransferase n=1 Tax=Massilia sp. CF038 TaxID=1881045 RepID=UPI000912F7D0|nr:TIGR03087 family PEP-CTERM/XrtA system glycosyltransferase [Massilia sp. CF038]SHH41561.1 sugar transferase, PEP-CTERM/EpsH1 system associated [Massilia sp. CF038]
MENLLLLIHRIPYPPNKGDKIRSYHLLKHLAQHYHVHLATFVDDEDDWQHVPTVQAMCTSSHFGKLNPLSGKLRSLAALTSKRSLSFDYYRSSAMQAWVDQTMAAHKIERVLVFSSPMAQYAEAYPAARRVVDFCDVDSDKWRQYASQKPWPMSWLYRREADTLLTYERHVAATCDASLFVSDPEAELFRTLAPESAAKIGYFNNGVDTDYFSPERTYARPYAAGERALVFTGAMDYWPNIDAVQWFANEIFPPLFKANPALRFYIVGARPTPAVSALGQLPGVTVTGTVPDVRPYIHHAEVTVAPLRIARGIQNKVLEAMAMARPMVVSPQALEGIDAIPGSELLLADGADAFIATLSALVATPNAALGSAARSKVERQYSWPSNLARIEARLECS